MCQVLRIQHQGRSGLPTRLLPQGTSAERLAGEDCGRVNTRQHFEGEGKGADGPDLKMEEGLQEEVIPTQRSEG